MADTLDRLQFRDMAGFTRGAITLLDAIETGAGTASFYFNTQTDAALVAVVGSGRELGRFTINNALVLKVARPLGDPVRLRVGAEEVEVQPTLPETERFEGTHAMLAVRNGEDVASVLEWIDYHRETQGMTAAVIVDRAAGANDDFDAALSAGLQAMGELAPRVTVLRSPHPLGKHDLPAESHPFCAPDAPGKDQIKVPPADPQNAPLGEMGIFEMMRERFLGRAAAVANIEINDLVLDDGAGTIFERAKATTVGVICLFVTRCYPWRVRPKDVVRFADHTCVQFDKRNSNRCWCIAPAAAPDKAIWRLAQIGNARADPNLTGRLFRFMGLRHSPEAISKIVPKAALIENDQLLKLSHKRFGHKPVRVPKIKAKKVDAGRGRTAIVTTMKNEGPFILEWIAYHRAIGIDDFLVYTNDCTDGTDTMLSMLQDKGIVQHRDNPYRESGMKPQHAALAAAQDEPVLDKAKWLLCIDVDEFINIKCGDGTLDALFEALPDANMISMTWRLFGNADVHEFRDEPLLHQLTACAPELTRKPHVAWGFKTMFQNNGIFKKMGVHRPKGLNPQLRNDLNWVNGSGLQMPESMYRNAWRSTNDTVGYDLVQLNHYAVRSAESFLVKRDRGRVNHVDRDQGLAYWFRMNNNAETDLSIQRMLPAVQVQMDALMADPDIAAAHAFSVKQHRDKIDALLQTVKYRNFYADLTGPRLQKLSRMHRHFGTSVFLSGPESVPDEIVWREVEEDFFFTIEMGEAVHN